jgi:hypothetical protein
MIGDIARYPYHLTDEKVRVEHWNVAQNQGRIAAEVIIGQLSSPEAPLPLFKHIPYFWLISVNAGPFNLENLSDMWVMLHHLTMLLFRDQQNWQPYLSQHFISVKERLWPFARLQKTL